MKMKLAATGSMLVVIFLLINYAQAMSSTTYTLDWFTPLTTNGGGAASSANYAVNLSVGQSAIGASSSDSYGAGLGYWYGAVVQYKLYLPLVLK